MVQGECRTGRRAENSQVSVGESSKCRQSGTRQLTKDGNGQFLVAAVRLLLPATMLARITRIA
jgi:hypothetical protein